MPEYDARYGHRGRVWCDGLERKYVRRCKTGVNGWVQYYIKDSNGRSVLNRERDAVLTRVVYGIVRFERGLRRG